MTQEIKIRCDVCGTTLKENEFKQNAPVMGFGGKPNSKCSMVLTHEGLKGSGDLCYSCSLKIKRFIEDMKASKK